MGGKLLLYGFSDLPSILAVEAAAKPFSAEVRPVGREEYRVPLGVLAEGRTVPAAPFPGALAGQMIVLCGLDGQVEPLVEALRRAGAGPSCCKAVLTKNNRNWDGLRLFTELQAERQAIEQMRKR